MPLASRSVVIPFGVPAEARGLGLGLAALVHGFVRLSKAPIALMQIFPRDGGSSNLPVESAVMPDAWLGAIPNPEDAPAALVLTGELDPPDTGSGHLTIVLFDGTSGTLVAREESSFDETNAGDAIVRALERVTASLGGDLGPLIHLAHSDWEGVESVLHAERLLLFDPSRQGPRDAIAASMYLDRAIADSPHARFAAMRLAGVALESNDTLDPSWDASLGRALERATSDAPEHDELWEARAALAIRRGQTEAARALAEQALETRPGQPRLVALLAEALRKDGDLDGAERALGRVDRDRASDPMLLATRGAVHASRGESRAAIQDWLAALERDPRSTFAFVHAADLAARVGDRQATTALVDLALAADAAAPAMLKRAIMLCLSDEPNGTARASRVATLAQRLAEHCPADPWTLLVLGRALARLGDADGARAQLDAVRRQAPDSLLAAEASHSLHALDAPDHARRVEEALRSVRDARWTALAPLVNQVTELSREERSWMAQLALGVGLRRIGAHDLARRAFEKAITIEAGCSEAHAELAELLIEAGRPREALMHIGETMRLEGESSAAHRAAAEAHAGLGEYADARRSAERAREMGADSETMHRLNREIDEREKRAQSWLDRLREWLAPAMRTADSSSR